MNILHVYKTSMPDSYGGVESFLDTLCKAGSKLGIKNTVMTLHPNPQKQPIKMSGYTVHQSKQNLFLASTGFSVKAFSNFKMLSKHSDIVHYHFPNPFADLLHFLTRVDKPTVLTYHSDIIKQKKLLMLYKPLMNKFLTSVGSIVAESPNYLNTSDVLKKYKDKVSVIPIGLDKSKYPALNKNRLQYWKKRFNGKFFLFVGALRYYKGLDILIKAAHTNHYPVIIVGTGSMEKALKEQVKNLGMNNVHFVGSVSDEDKVALINLCYAFLFPSHLRSEAFGISLLEAAMYGKPLISCEIGTGTSYINIDGHTGLVIPPSNPKALNDAMGHLYKNENLAHKLGKNAKKRFYSIFKSDTMALSYYQLYQKVLLNKQHA